MEKKTKERLERIINLCPNMTKMKYIVKRKKVPTYKLYMKMISEKI